MNQRFQTLDGVLDRLLAAGLRQRGFFAGGRLDRLGRRLLALPGQKALGQETLDRRGGRLASRRLVRRCRRLGRLLLAAQQRLETGAQSAGPERSGTGSAGRARGTGRLATACGTTGASAGTAAGHALQEAAQPAGSAGTFATTRDALDQSPHAAGRAGAFAAAGYPFDQAADTAGSPGAFATAGHAFDQSTDATGRTGPFAATGHAFDEAADRAGRAAFAAARHTFDQRADTAGGTGTQGAGPERVERQVDTELLGDVAHLARHLGEPRRIGRGGLEHRLPVDVVGHVAPGTGQADRDRQARDALVAALALEAGDQLRLDAVVDGLWR